MATKTFTCMVCDRTFEADFGVISAEFTCPECLAKQSDYRLSRIVAIQKAREKALAMMPPKQREAWIAKWAHDMATQEVEEGTKLDCWLASGMNCVLGVGVVFKGYCGGSFGRDAYGQKRVEAFGPDWIVCRGVKDDRALFFASFSSPAEMAKCVAEFVVEKGPDE